jgi:hypothetical protein
MIVSFACRRGIHEMVGCVVAHGCGHIAVGDGPLRLDRLRLQPALKRLDARLGNTQSVFLI